MRRRRAYIGMNPANIGWLKRQPRRRVMQRREPWRPRLNNAADFEPGGKYYKGADDD